MTTPKPDPVPRFDLAAAMAKQTQTPTPERKAYSLVDAMRRLTLEDSK